MSTLLVSENYFVVTSGLKFWIIQKSGLENGNLDFIERELPEALPAKKTEDTQVVKKVAGQSKGGSILASCLSKDGRFVAFFDDRKQLTLWNCSDWSLLKQWVLPRRANRIIFNKTLTSLLVADKGGDVFEFDITKENAEDGVCLLGHLSMLLDVVLSPCGKFIITSDRDEKIRVSHYPNSYNIHNYLLGHTEFVTGLAICPHNESILISSSGDGTLKVWDYLNSRQLESRLCSEDLGSNLGSEGSDDKGPKVPAVTAIQCRKISDDATLIAATIDRHNGFLVYSLSGSANQLSFHYKVSTESPFWDFKFDHSLPVLIGLLSSQSSQIVRYELSADKMTEKSIDFSSESVKELEIFFEAARTHPVSTKVTDLYKRWFDNMADYMGRKEVRLNTKKVKKISENEEDKKRVKL